MPDREGDGLAIPTFKKKTSVVVYFKDIESKTKNCEQSNDCSLTNYSIIYWVTKVNNILTNVKQIVHVRRSRPICVIPRTLMTQIQFTHQRTVDVVDREQHIAVVC